MASKQGQRAEYCVRMFDMLPAMELGQELNSMARLGFVLQQSHPMMMPGEPQMTATVLGNVPMPTQKMVLHCIFVKPLAVALPGDEWMDAAEEDGE